MSRLTSDEETFGKWLKARREERGLTLRDVERITEGRLSNAAVSQMETGKTENPSVKALHLVAAALGLDFAEVCAKAALGDSVPMPDFCPSCGQVIR